MSDSDACTEDEKRELDRRADALWEGKGLTFEEWAERDGSS